MWQFEPVSREVISGVVWQFEPVSREVNYIRSCVAA